MVGVIARDLCPYVERAPEYEIRDGVVCCDFGGWSIHMPMRVFRIAHARAAKAVKDYDASGEVVPFRGGK